MRGIREIREIELQATLKHIASELRNVYSILDRVELTLASLENVIERVCENYGINLYEEFEEINIEGVKYEKL